MRIKSIQIENLKRFNNLQIAELPESVKLVVLLGPNGCGKSSLFDLLYSNLKTSRLHGYSTQDMFYFYRDLESSRDTNPLDQDMANRVKIDFHGKYPQTDEERKRSIHLRTAYRNEASFNLSGLDTPPSVLDENLGTKTIDDDKSVSANFQRLAVNILARATTPGLSTDQIMKELTGEINTGLEEVFGDLRLDAFVSPTQYGTFVFEKDGQVKYLYENLSGGEKAVFDLLLDVVIKRQDYHDTIYCVDEPEIHLNSRVQARLLRVLFELVPNTSQLWIATHSIGMMREATRLLKENPDKVSFLDFGFDFDGNPRDFNGSVIISPVVPNRVFWERHYDVALDDLASLVMPGRVVICEGEPKISGSSHNFSHDARCYELIFQDEFPDTKFVPGGNSSEVTYDRRGIAYALEVLASGVDVVRLIDGDDHSPQQIMEYRYRNVRVLSYRNLETCLFDDEVLKLLASATGNDDKANELVTRKNEIVSANDEAAHDDLKPASGEIYNACKSILRLTKSGNDSRAFMRDTLAPLVRPGTTVYSELKKDIFE